MQPRIRNRQNTCLPIRKDPDILKSRYVAILFVHGRHDGLWGISLPPKENLGSNLMLLTRRQFRCALVVPTLLFGTLGMTVGCGSDPDATGDAGIGAPGKLPDTPIPSEEEAYEEQMKREKELMKKEK
jgi:hypothetical protein